MATTTQNPETPTTTAAGDYHDEEEAHEEEDQVQEWDEGGPSHCGYSESVHETLMAVGKGVHSVVGEPSPTVEQGMIKSVGNWFQEASYAVRDFVRGNKEVSDDASQTFNDLKEGALTAIMGEQQEAAANGTTTTATSSNENQVPAQQ